MYNQSCSICRNSLYVQSRLHNMEILYHHIHIHRSLGNSMNPSIFVYPVIKIANWKNRIYNVHAVLKMFVQVEKTHSANTCRDPTIFVPTQNQPYLFRFNLKILTPPSLLTRILFTFVQSNGTQTVLIFS